MMMRRMVVGVVMVVGRRPSVRWLPYVCPCSDIRGLDTHGVGADGWWGSGSKYKFMENQMTRNKQNTKAKIPEIEKTLSLVRFLKEKQVCAF